MMKQFTIWPYLFHHLCTTLYPYVLYLFVFDLFSLVHTKLDWLPCVQYIRPGAFVIHHQCGHMWTTSYANIRTFVAKVYADTFSLYDWREMDLLVLFLIKMVLLGAYICMWPEENESFPTCGNEYEISRINRFSISGGSKIANNWLQVSFTKNTCKAKILDFKYLIFLLEKPSLLDTWINNWFLFWLNEHWEKLRKHKSLNWAFGRGC